MLIALLLAVATPAVAQASTYSRPASAGLSA